jgi:hypothetical protein
MQASFQQNVCTAGCLAYDYDGVCKSLNLCKGLVTWMPRPLYPAMLRSVVKPVLSVKHNIQEITVLQMRVKVVVW